MAQLMPLPVTVSCFSKIQIGFNFLAPAHLVSLRKGPINGRVCNMMCFKCGIVFHNDYSEFRVMSSNEKNSVN